MNRCKECGTLYYSTMYEAMYGSDELRDPDWVCPECRERMEQKEGKE